MSDYVEATPANMRQYGPGVVALDRATGATYSANPNDYFMVADDEPLVNDDGEPLVLAITIAESHEPLMPRG